MAESHLDQRAAALAATMRRDGHWVSPDLRVREVVAAEFLGHSPKTLRNWRALGARRLRFVRARQVTYFLADLIAFLDERTER